MTTAINDLIINKSIDVVVKRLPTDSNKQHMWVHQYTRDNEGRSLRTKSRLCPRGDVFVANVDYDRNELASACTRAHYYYANRSPTSHDDFASSDADCFHLTSILHAKLTGLPGSRLTPYSATHQWTYCPRRIYYQIEICSSSQTHLGRQSQHSACTA
jgi:hypothetical protein